MATWLNWPGSTPCVWSPWTGAFRTRCSLGRAELIYFAKLMFTPEEKPLLTGTDDEVSDFVDSERCMVVDWRGTEEEAVDDAARWLPAGTLTHEVTNADDGGVSVELRFRDRKEEITLPPQEQNNFRILLRVGRILQPEYLIKIFRCTQDSDTNAFLLRPAEWWTAFQSQYPKRDDAIFAGLDELTEMWGLDG